MSFICAPQLLPSPEDDAFAPFHNWRAKATNQELRWTKRVRDQHGFADSQGPPLELSEQVLKDQLAAVSSDYHEALDLLQVDSPLSAVLPPDILNLINKAYLTNLHPCIAYLGHPTETKWHRGMKIYLESIRKLLHGWWRKQLELYVDNENSPEYLAFSGAPARYAYIMSLREAELHLSLPWPTTSFLADVQVRLAEASYSMPWVSCAF